MAYQQNRKRLNSTEQNVDGPMYRPKGAAVYLDVSEQTLAHWRSKGSGPAYIRLSARCIRYTEAALREFAQDRAQSSTVEND